MATLKAPKTYRVKSKEIKWFTRESNKKISGVNYTPSMYESGNEFTVIFTPEFDLYKSERSMHYLKDWLIFLDEDTLFKFD